MRNLFILLLIAIAFVSCKANESVEVQPPTLTSSQTDEEISTQEVASVDEFSLDLTRLEVISPENVSQLQELVTLAGHFDVVTAVSFNQDGTRLASSGMDRLVRLWDLSSGVEYASLKHGPQAFGNDFSIDGVHMASAGTDKFVRIWNIETAEEVYALEGHVTGVLDVAYSPDGKLLASASRDGAIKIWDPDSGQEIRTIKAHYEDIYNIAYHPEGSMIASASIDETVRIWDPVTGEELQVLTDHKDDVYYVTFSQDGTMLVSCGGGLPGTGNSALIWDTTTWKVINQINDRESAVVGCGFSVDGKLLVTRESSGLISFWDLHSMEILNSLNLWGFTYATDLDSEGRLLAVGDADGAIHLYGIPE